MRRALAVLRPEPGNAATAARIEAIGLSVVRLPLFAARPLDWVPPAPLDFDAIVLTSANAVRLAGPTLARYQALPAFAVGAATARAARAAGLAVALTGTADAAALAAAMESRGVKNALWLTGRDHGDMMAGMVAATIPVYAMVPVQLTCDALERLLGTVALVHSPRAGQWLSALAGRCGIDRTAVRIAAISPAVAAATGDFWHAVAVAPTPDDRALVELAAHLARLPD
ncbi:uroporphyrinogen-III synthase [uncultured Sphingomonas sp.]|uniref:uroporphyrinogen-III synthase n=1 Tax=uncultured Sphingomonas sp. TaxID=158754 RepID=UPI0035CC9687